MVASGGVDEATNTLRFMNAAHSATSAFFIAPAFHLSEPQTPARAVTLSVSASKL
jgi:hypothetical protein